MQNIVRATILILILTVLFVVIGLVVGGVSGMVIALGFSIFTHLVAFWTSDRLVLRMQNARLLGLGQAPELRDMVDVLSARGGIPSPQIYIIEHEQPNAFATGRSPRNAALAISTGLMRHLNKAELAAVVAHELAHIRSNDILVMTLTATMAGAISMLAQFGLFFGGRSAANPFGPVGALLAIIIAPIVAIMVQMAMSRTREYEADRVGSQISGDPLALASALQKISRLTDKFENKWAQQSPGMAHLFIVNPLTGGKSDSLFSTHPRVENRIAKLHKQAEEMQRRSELYPSNKEEVPFSSQSRASWAGANEKVEILGGKSWRPPSSGRWGHLRGPWG